MKEVLRKLGLRGQTPVLVLNAPWDVLIPLGFEPVAQVAIDEDWSALRFRPAGKVKHKGRSGL